MTKFFKSKKRIVLVSIALALVATISFVAVSQLQKNTETANTIKPDFNALLPVGSSIEELGGWQKLTPPTGDVYYVFTDSIGQKPIAVSQQVLPSTFKNSPAQSVEELAKAYSATETFSANATKVYIGNSVSGPQSVIFVKNNLLVLIKSQEKIDNSAWTEYINSLQ